MAFDLVHYQFLYTREKLYSYLQVVMFELEGLLVLEQCIILSF